MDKKDQTKSDKKGFWAILKESMNKSSSGCGPGCGCHVENGSSENAPKVTPDKPGHDEEQR